MLRGQEKVIMKDIKRSIRGTNHGENKQQE